MRSDICVIDVPEEEEEGGAEKVLEEIMAANLPNLAKDTKVQIQEGRYI